MTYFACIKNDINRQVVDTLDNQLMQPFAHFKISFFQEDKSVYAIPRIPCGLESTTDTAVKLVRKESIELQRYMRDVYQIDDKICGETGAIRFPCKDRWLRGEEYGFLIRHFWVYSHVLKFHILSEKYHPKMVYERPEGKIHRSLNNFIFLTDYNINPFYRWHSLLHPGTPLAGLWVPPRQDPQR